VSDSSALAATVPEVYYDLIARVPPGVVLLGILAAAHHPLQPKEITAGVVAAFLLFGYTAGIVLSGAGIWLAVGVWHLSWWWAARKNTVLKEQRKKYENDLPRLFEHLCERNRNVLNKLTAEVMLCANLVVAFVLLALAPGPRVSRQQMIIGAVVSFIALCTRQYNATKRQTTLVLNEAAESVPELPI
jgi:hypothetical protein